MSTNPTIITDRRIIERGAPINTALRLTITEDLDANRMTATIRDHDDFLLADGIWGANQGKGWTDDELAELIEDTINAIVAYNESGDRDDLHLGCGWEYHEKPEPLTTTDRALWPVKVAGYHVRRTFLRAVWPLWRPFSEALWRRRAEKHFANESNGF